MKSLGFIVFVVAFVSLVDADMYMHNPRGSNNRLNEESATRANGNRVFDSQNNARGGYNIGDLTHEKAGDDATKQYKMEYVMSPLDPNLGESIMNIEWTNQHGCGSNTDTETNKLNCNIVIQMMCQSEYGGGTRSKIDEMRDGTKTDTNDYQEPKDNENYDTFMNRKNGQVKSDRALHEPFEWYDKCTQRERSKGLFTADQQLQGHSAKYTRQNREGTRRGYECPEERDYYPYWHPTHWKDIMVLAEREERCDFYKKNSFNVAPKYECVSKWSNGKLKHYSKFNNKEDCEKVTDPKENSQKDSGHKWLAFHNYLEILEHNEPDCNAKNKTGVLKDKLIWGRPMLHATARCLVKLEEPECRASPYSRVNHLGNGLDLEPNSVKWKIPAFPSQKRQKCVLRLRYNISTDDYDYTNTTNDGKVGKVYLGSGPEVKSMGDFTPLPKDKDVGKMYWGLTDDGQFKAGEYVVYEKYKPETRGNQWFGFQSAYFNNKYLRYRFWIKFIGKVPPPSDNFGFKVLGVVHNDWVLTCKKDEWCYVERLVMTPNGNNPREVDHFHVILIFDTIQGTQTIHFAKMEVEVYESAIEDNPLVNVGNTGHGLRLAINTAQFGRTFQDRSHVFILKHMDIFKGQNEVLQVIQVRGKRGNIVQTFPAVEYDFYPTNLVMREKDMVHFTWTGSNSHKNNGNGGDGQTGDAGQGTSGTDRSNICSVNNRDLNFPMLVDNPESICQNIKEIVWSNYTVNEDFEKAKWDVCIQLMSAGYYWCFQKHNECKGNSLSEKKEMSDLLNDAPASYPGVIVKLKAGTYHYISSRNNAFTNRSQKATIIVLAEEE